LRNAFALTNCATLWITSNVASATTTQPTGIPTTATPMLFDVAKKSSAFEDFATGTMKPIMIVAIVISTVFGVMTIVVVFVLVRRWQRMKQEQSWEQTNNVPKAQNAPQWQKAELDGQATGIYNGNVSPEIQGNQVHELSIPTAQRVEIADTTRFELEATQIEEIDAIEVVLAPARRVEKTPII
jgi:hypothetical protein